MDFKVKLKLEWKGDEAVSALVTGAYEAALDTAVETMIDAQDRAPKHTGTLARTGAVTVNYVPPARSVFEAAGGGKRFTGTNHLRILLPKTRPKTRNIRIYLTFSAPYALQAHENMNNRTGSPKFLEIPAMSMRERLLKHAPARTKQALKNVRLINRFS